MSGNFAVLAGSGIFQILDTTSSKRYNIASCNGPRVAALDSTKALINDCETNGLMDLNTGSRTAVGAGIAGFNHEFITTENGAIFLSQSCPSNAQMAFRLCRVRANGAVESIASDGFSPGASSCMNCGAKNTVLFGTGKYLVVRELTQLSYVQIGIDEKKVLLPGVNVTGVGVRGDELYYFGENSKGEPVVGKYNLSTQKDEPLPLTSKLSDLDVVSE
jgi:hypothetical protein